jgi:hypothetical protein
MTKAWVVAASAYLATGCTTVSLERYTLSQVHSVADYRYNGALHCLAQVAADPTALPSYAQIAWGVTRVQDQEMLNPTTTWSRAAHGFAMQSLAVMGSRSPQEQWNVDPVADETQLRAMRCACRWVIYGPEHACDECSGILADPEKDPSPGPHFGVADRLARLPAGWLHVGHWRDLPAEACYVAHCGDTWVWVMPDGLEGLANFTLVLQDIATLDLVNGATEAPPLFLVLWVGQQIPYPPAQKQGQSESNKPTHDPGYSDVLVFRMDRVLKPEYKAELQNWIQKGASTGKTLGITWDQWMTWTAPYHGPKVTVSAPSLAVPASGAGSIGPYRYPLPGPPGSPLIEIPTTFPGWHPIKNPKFKQQDQPE